MCARLAQADSCSYCIDNGGEVASAGVITRRVSDLWVSPCLSSHAQLLSAPLVLCRYYSSRITPLYTALHANASGQLSPPRPSLHANPVNLLVVPSPREYYTLDWGTGLTDALLGHSLADPSLVTTVYSDDPWTRQWSEASVVCVPNAALFVGEEP